MADVESSFEKARSKMITARVEFMSQLAKFSQDELEQKVAEGEWSPLRIVQHILITDGLFLEQMRRVQEEENPLLESGTQRAPYLTNSAEPPTSLAPLLSAMAAQRQEIFSYLLSLPNEAWTRPLRHEEWGPLKFYQLVNILPKHDQQHTQQLIAIKEKLDGQKVV